MSFVAFLRGRVAPRPNPPSLHASSAERAAAGWVELFGVASTILHEIILDEIDDDDLRWCKEFWFTRDADPAVLDAIDEALSQDDEVAEGFADALARVGREATDAEGRPLRPTEAVHRWVGDHLAGEVRELWLRVP